VRDTRFEDFTTHTVQFVKYFFGFLLNTLLCVEMMLNTFINLFLIVWWNRPHFIKFTKFPH